MTVVWLCLITNPITKSFLNFCNFRGNVNIMPSQLYIVLQMINNFNDFYYFFAKLTKLYSFHCLYEKKMLGTRNMNKKRVIYTLVNFVIISKISQSFYIYCDSAS